METEFESLYLQTKAAFAEYFEKCAAAQHPLQPGALLAVGCSTSEIVGGEIGHCSVPEAAQAVMRAVGEELVARGIFLAAQCCEHLNRALITEREYAVSHGLEIVSVVPYPKAGGSFATAAYAAMRDPVAVEVVRAQGGIDIGGTLIGMHLCPVAVPLRLTNDRIGKARLLCAYTRPKFIGGARARYE